MSAATLYHCPIVSERVRITDVSPRDGLQNESGAIPTADKVRLIELLASSGVDEVEVTSFVSPRWVPQLADSADVASAVRDFAEGVRSVQGTLSRDASGGGDPLPVFSVLVPNEKGFDRALGFHEEGLPLKIALFTAASETFSRKNTNASIAETLERFAPIVPRAREAGMEIRGYVSCVIACPFEGAIDPGAVADVSRSLLELGVTEIDLGDTIGAGTPESTRAMLEATSRVTGGAPVTLHLHDTFGRASDCVREALAMGIRSFDGSVAGLGGCPYASTPEKRAPGNISTEALVRTVEEAGFETGVDHDALRGAGELAARVVAEARAQEAGA